MRTHASYFGLALLAAGVVACSGRTERVDSPRHTRPGDRRGSYERVLLQGCVEAGTPAGEYVLQNVNVPTPPSQPQGQDTMEHRIPVAQGSSVRLAGAGDDLKKNLGKRVEVLGEFVEGANTAGTSGRTTAGADASSLQIAVEKVETMANSCGANATEPNASGR